MLVTYHTMCTPRMVIKWSINDLIWTSVIPVTKGNGHFCIDYSPVFLIEIITMDYIIIIIIVAVVIAVAAAVVVVVHC